MRTTDTPASPDARLQRLLGGAQLNSLRQRMRRYFERVDNGTAGSSLLLSQLSLAEQEALELLIGRPSRISRSVRVDIERLDSALREAGIADSLRAALERIDGPIVSRAAVRANTSAQWTSMIALDSWHGVLRTWLTTPAALGLLKRLSRQDPMTGQQLLGRADATLHRLPAHGIARSQLAAETLGNAHALDGGEPTATIVLSAWRHMERTASYDDNMRDAKGNPVEPPQLDDRARDIWARAGVLVNELSRPALFLNLPVTAGDPVGESPGEPGYASLRRLLRTPPAWSVRGTTVFVCENPNLVAIAADQLGAASAPLVCTDGMPAAAQRTLLTQLAYAGAHLTYHGDFDWPGLQIGNQVMSTWQASPWRFATHDYKAAVTNSPPVTHELSGASVSASWDESLADVMQSHGIAIAEEAMAAVLLEDLSQRCR
ncbi:TIGR02679 family protein [Trinickia dabaoshanensis]|uniref:TIGR02679 family protein n=2 Tax=Trinickia dabaoshanensis TaxID=564714 RepID=A0A2N7W3K2_9BURK|nr:TIGR02679 family protein [Trinickia dabaoshanensis]